MLIDLSSFIKPARDHKTKNWLLAPNIQILGSKKHIFAPSGQFEPHRSMFSTRKRCLIGIPIRGYQNFYSLPPKNWILGPKTAKFGPKLAFLAKYRHFCPKYPNFWVKKAHFYSLPPKMYFWPKNGQIWPKIGIFGQILAFLAYLIPWPTKQWCKQVA